MLIEIDLLLLKIKMKILTIKNLITLSKKVMII